MSPAYRKFLYPFLAVGVVVLSTMAVAGCDQQGPAEKAGEAVDETVNDAARAVKDAAD